MRGLFYKALGYLVWKGYVADMRRRARIAAKRAGIALLLTIAVYAVRARLAQGRDASAR